MKFPKVYFNNDSATKFGGFPYVDAFKQSIGWAELLKEV
jgi:hypothetical protein